MHAKESDDLTAAVRLENISKSFGRHRAVSDLSLEVPEGAVYGFIGPNGSGKTTTIRMILHIFLPDRGTVEVLGQRGTRAANDLIGYLPEERGLYKKMSVRRILHYYGSLKGMGRADLRGEIVRWLQIMGLEDWLNRKVETLSKGMAQKVQFIAAVIARPRLLILDEPFSGLDPVNLEVIRGVILDLRRAGTTIIFSTHDMSMAETMCDALFMICRGQKVLDGPLESIQAEYGEDVIHLRGDVGREELESLAGVESVRELGRDREIRFAGNPQELLQHLVRSHRVERFEVAHPSLHDIFIRIAGPTAEEAQDE